MLAHSMCLLFLSNVKAQSVSNLSKNLTYNQSFDLDCDGVKNQVEGTWNIHSVSHEGKTPLLSWTKVQIHGIFYCKDLEETFRINFNRKQGAFLPPYEPWVLKEKFVAVGDKGSRVIFSWHYYYQWLPFEIITIDLKAKCL